MTTKRYWSPFAWVDGEWRKDVLLEVSPNGTWADIAPDTRPIPPDTTVLSGPILPGLVNAHSHTFQRAFAGLAERRDAAEDDFWSWRDRMYSVANRVTASQLHTIAKQLYIELLKGGYTQVCEFHYLQRDENAKPYDSPYELAWEIASAATNIGIGITILPSLYEHAGFDHPGVNTSQQRFLTSPEFVYGLHKDIMRSSLNLVNSGVSIHSLRAASPPSIAKLLSLVGSDDIPIHIHIAEQSKELTDCVAATGVRPIEYLCGLVNTDARWQLIHAIHATQCEIQLVAASEAGIVICPSTEANLGDGLVALADWLDAGVPVTIGSDSHVCRNWSEEIRWLEYSQRLHLQKRNIAASPQSRQPSTAARLFNAVLNGGGGAAGFTKWGLEIGARADFLVVNPNSASLLGIPAPFMLDSIIFSAGEPTINDVYVAGALIITNGRHPQEKEVAEQFASVMRSLWQRSPEV